MYELGQIWIADESLMNVGADKLYFADVGSAHLRSETRKNEAHNCTLSTDYMRDDYFRVTLELAEIGLSKIKTPCFVKVVKLQDSHRNGQRS